MNILLIAVPVVDIHEGQFYTIGMDSKKLTPPAGVYLLAAMLKKHNHLVVMADLIAEGIENLDKYIADINNFDLVGIGATSFSWPTALKCIKSVREVNKEIPIVLGGVHPTMFDHYILSRFKATFIIRGEAEKSIVELCDHLTGKLDISLVYNLSYRNIDGRVIRNPIRKLINLSELPIPDYSLLPDKQYFSLSVESSRGCPFDCIFCSTMYRKTYRCLEAEKFVENIENIIPFLSKTNDNTIYIVDDEFTLRQKRVIDTMHLIKDRSLDIKLRFDARAPDLLNEELVSSVVPHLDRFLVGAECGYDEGLKKIGKKISVQQIEKAAAVLHKYGIAHLSDFSFVIGYPWEKYEDALRTIDFASKLVIKYNINIYLQYYIQIPGSRLWEEQRNAGIITEVFYDNFGLFNNPYIFRTGTLFSIQEFESISKIVASIRMLYKMSILSNNNDIYYSHPLPLRNYYYKSLRDSQSLSGLNSLRECCMKPASIINH